MTPIRVLLVDDSDVVLAILKQILTDSPEIQVAGTARDGAEALGMVPALNPDVICTDLEMPGMDGRELTVEVMSQFPRPILVVSDYVHKEHGQNVFDVLEAGAIDVFPKPRLRGKQDYATIATQLASKIRVASGVVVFPKPRPAAGRDTSGPDGAGPGAVLPDTSGRAVSPLIITIGASTGGPQALRTVLERLPAGFPVPVVCVQHISSGFTEGLVEWLAAQCPMKVRMARGGEQPVAGTIYFPQEGRHVKFDPGGSFYFSSEPRESLHIPSIDVMFGSAAEAYGSAVTGVILTGMGQDGAAGLKAIHDAGGFTIAQDEASCVVFGMPRRAIEMGAARHVLPLEEIPVLLTGSCFVNRTAQF